MPKVKPLKSRTMTLDELQRETLKFIGQVRRQLNRMPHMEGMSDNEFLDQVVDPLEHKIRNDRDVLRMARKVESD